MNLEQLKSILMSAKKPIVNSFKNSSELLDNGVEAAEGVSKAAMAKILGKDVGHKYFSNLSVSPGKRSSQEIKSLMSRIKNRKSGLVPLGLGVGGITAYETKKALDKDDE